MATKESAADPRRRRLRSTLGIVLAAAVAFVALLALATPAAAHEMVGPASLPAGQTVGPPAPTPDPPAPPAPAAPAPPGELAYTGSTTWVLGILGAVLVLSGCALVMASRRRVGLAGEVSPDARRRPESGAAHRRATCRPRRGRAAGPSPNVEHSHIEDSAGARRSHMSSVQDRTGVW